MLRTDAARARHTVRRRAQSAPPWTPTYVDRASSRTQLHAKPV